MSRHRSQAIITAIDQFSERLGRSVAWLTLALVLLTFLVVVLRYLFNIGSVALQESLLYIHSLIFMLGAAYTLLHDAHVRVDVLYRPLNARRKALINLLGTLFILFPFCGFIGYISWEYVSNSWGYWEGSRESGGLDAVFMLKGLILTMPLLLILQGIAESLRSILILQGQDIPPVDDSGVTL